MNFKAGNWMPSSNKMPTIEPIPNPALRDLLSSVFEEIEPSLDRSIRVQPDEIPGDDHGFSEDDEIILDGLAFDCPSNAGITGPIFPAPQTTFKVETVGTTTTHQL